MCVYNFGCGRYYSTQERVLFEQLVSSGAVPDLAVFLDGPDHAADPTSDEPHALNTTPVMPSFR